MSEMVENQVRMMFMIDQLLCTGDKSLLPSLKITPPLPADSKGAPPKPKRCPFRRADKKRLTMPPAGYSRYSPTLLFRI